MPKLVYVMDLSDPVQESAWRIILNHDPGARVRDHNQVNEPRYSWRLGDLSAPDAVLIMIGHEDGSHFEDSRFFHEMDAKLQEVVSGASRIVLLSCSTAEAARLYLTGEQSSFARDLSIQRQKIVEAPLGDVVVGRELTVKCDGFEREVWRRESWKVFEHGEVRPDWHHEFSFMRRI